MNNLSAINHKASFEIILYELPKRIEEYLYKNRINMSFNDVVSKI
jgi:hypothetical protein